MSRLFLIVTANKHETSALLTCSDFKITERDVRSNIKDDDNFYTTGILGEHSIIHLELQSQGSLRSSASLLSIQTAIDYWQPDALILLGIAFGKGNGNNADTGQHIGDVLVSEKVVDYESGKCEKGVFQTDASVPDAGKTLLSVFKHFSKTWKHKVYNREAQCHFGLMLSGDKVVNDPDFKRQLFERYPRAIGGEMEGRGVCAACRNKRLDEWIVVKAICDWGENKENPSKESDQKKAAEAAVSLLTHVFSQESAFAKLPAKTKPEPCTDLQHEGAATPQHPAQQNVGTNNKNVPLGYFISIGTTSCRLFQVKDNKTLSERVLISYDISDTKDDGYLPGIIRHVQQGILPKIEQKPARLFSKVFVDYNFATVFEAQDDPSAKDDFLLEFYEKTGLCFNILTKSQTIENLKRLFGTMPHNTAIIIINSGYIDILEYSGTEFYMHSIDITLDDIKKFVKQEEYPEIWNDSIISNIKSHVSQKIGNALDGISITTAIIIKDELDFMQKMGYPLKHQDGQLSLTRRSYRTANHEKLFKVDFKSKLSEQNSDESAVKRLYAFRYGHIILETILEKVGCKTVIPKDDHSIHGSGVDAYISYIFNVVISGSTHEGRDTYMAEARDLLHKMGANVLSPHIDGNGMLEEITPTTEFKHLKAIRECDMLFVSNKGFDGYIGDSTKNEIYFAYALYKPIAFWRDPPEDNRISFIPRERWGPIMALEK